MREYRYSPPDAEKKKFNIPAWLNLAAGVLASLGFAAKDKQSVDSSEIKSVDNKPVAPVKMSAADLVDLRQVDPVTVDHYRPPKTTQTSATDTKPEKTIKESAENFDQRFDDIYSGVQDIFPEYDISVGSAQKVNFFKTKTTADGDVVPVDFDKEMRLFHKDDQSHPDVIITVFRNGGAMIHFVGTDIKRSIEDSSLKSIQANWLEMEGEYKKLVEDERNNEIAEK